jgi:hypothetical protein
VVDVKEEARDQVVNPDLPQFLDEHRRIRKVEKHQNPPLALRPMIGPKDKAAEDSRPDQSPDFR